MPRVTLRLSDERYEALRDAAVMRGTSMSRLVDDALLFAGIGVTTDTISILEEASTESGVSEEEAMHLALAETRVYRDELTRRRAR